MLYIISSPKVGLPRKFDYKQFKTIQRVGKIPPNAEQCKHKRIKAGRYLLSPRCSWQRQIPQAMRILHII